MKEFEILKEKYQPNVPILFEEIIELFSDRSRQWIYNTLKAMIASRKLARFSTGVYYIPKYVFLSNDDISVEKVVNKKYITDNDNVYGYYSGASLLYALEIIDRKPDTITVVSNNEKSRGRTITIRQQRIHVSKAPVQVNRQNHLTLQFLEAIKLTEKADDDTTEQKIYEYARAKRIAINDVSMYCKFFPDLVSKSILSGKQLQLLIHNQNRSLFHWNT